MKMSKVWAMPNSKTFDIKPIREIIERYNTGGVVIDPFANDSKIANITNDLDPDFKTNFNLDAIDFLKLLNDGSVDMVLYDPPSSPRQVAESYKKLEKSVNRQTTQASYWGNQKKEISRVVKKGGIVVTCGWNSGGIGKKHGFETLEILLVAHGGWHNDTIVTIERKR